MAHRRYSLRTYLPAVIAGFIVVLLLVMRTIGADLPVVAATSFVVGLACLAFALGDMLVSDVRRTYVESIQFRAVVLAVMIVETVLLFATTYRTVSDLPGEINGLSTPLDAVYFTMTTLMTIGFGDISAEGQLARGLVLTQMVFTVLLLTASVRLFTSLVRALTVQEGERRRD